MHPSSIKVRRSILVLLIITASCRVVLTGETQPASQPTHETASLPEKTFEVFWQTFEDQYAFFDLRKVDWHTTYKKFRPLVNSNTTPDSLFSILCEMVKPLQDDHVTVHFVHKRKYREFIAAKPSRFLQEFPNKATLDLFWKTIDHTLLKNGFHKPVNLGPKEDGVPLFQYTHSASTGYIRFTRCNVSPETENDPIRDAILAGTLLDSILQQLTAKDQIILDIRANEGGFDEFAYAIAGRFTDTTRIGHYKQKRSGSYTEFTPLVPWYIKPQGRIYTKPVVVLTNDQTASAADVMAMIMKAIPNTKIIGENSTGIYSDMYGFMLPNGWVASLSNERYFSHDMKCYEGIGTPVDVKISNTQIDLILARDGVLSKALEIIDN